MNEGKATMGLWLPLALSDLYSLLLILIRMQCANPEQVKIPERSDIVAGWCLPMLSKSLKADEEEHKALEMFESVKRLKCKYEQENQI